MMLNITIDKSDLLFGLSVIGVVLTFINVNRQRKASLQNDEEKFKREHNLQTYNEFVEILYQLLIVIRGIKSLGNRYEVVVSSKPKDLITSLNEITWEITDHKEWITSTEKIRAYFIKREYVLKLFEDKIEQIAILNNQIDKNFWLFKLHVWEHDERVEDIKNTLQTLETLSEKLISEITILIRMLQKEFLGHMYKHSLVTR
ncbi:hypothetical protein ACX1C1_19625 [Paenibacillus sp. strain BS8-2]